MTFIERQGTPTPRERLVSRRHVDLCRLGADMCPRPGEMRPRS